MRTPKEYLNLIDEKFNDAKAKKLSRLSVEWGKWSREMNLELRERIDSGTDPEEVRLKYVFMYWIVKSQLLELNLKTKIIGPSRRKKKEKEAKFIKNVILKPGKLKNIELDLKAIVQMIR